MKKNILAALALVATLGMVSCSKDPDPTPDPTPSGDYLTFSSAVKDVYKGKKFVLTTCGETGTDQAVNWLNGFGYTQYTSFEDAEKAEAGSKWYVFDKLIDLSKIPSDYVVLCGVCFTGKGLTTSAADQISRAEALANLKTQSKIAGLVLIQTAGSTCRGTTCDQMLAKLVPATDCAIISNAANTDSYWNSAKATYTKLEVCEAKKAADLKAGFTYLGL